jgi:RNase P subunit RPR2
MEKKEKSNSNSQQIDKINKKIIKPIKIRFCPKCNSTNVGFVFRIQNMFGLLPKVECKRCGYNQNEFPIVVITKEELEKREGKKQKKKNIKKTIKKTKGNKNKKGAKK